MNTKLKFCELFRDERLFSDLLNRCVIIGETVKRSMIYSIVMMLAMFTGTNSAHAQTASGSINGHDYVDLGLSVKWATCNVGASSPEAYGSYFAWGEISSKSSYNKDNSRTHGNSTYDSDIGGRKELDAARANWGGSWRLPTQAEVQELIDKCDWIRSTQGGKSGFKEGIMVVGPSGRSIFLPYAGYCKGENAAMLARRVITGPLHRLELSAHVLSISEA